MSIAGRVASALKGAVRSAFPFLRRPSVANRLHVLTDSLRDVLFRMRSVGRGRDFAVHIPRRGRRVAFVTEDGVFKRELKIAYALKKAGWEVLLLHRNAPLKAIEPNLFAEIQHYHSPMEAVALARTSGSRLFHYFSNAADTTGRALVDNKPGRVIVDFYDFYYARVAGLLAQERDSSHIVAEQRYCIERADAVTAKDLQLCYRRRETRLGRGKPLLYFPNYCWDRTPLRTKAPSEEVHVVQAAGMEFETRGSYDISCFHVIREFVNAGCHFHFYLIPGFGATLDAPGVKYLYADYLDLQARTGRVHFHSTVPPHVLVDELQNYDYGFNMLNAANFDVPWVHENPAWLPLLASGRLFDYLDAGIGMIVDGMLRFNRHLFGPTGAYIDGTALLRSGAIVEGLQNPPSRTALLQARAALGVERHIGRLTRFYEQLE